MLESAVRNTSSYLNNTFHSLKIRNFRYFWIGQCVSLVGTFMQRTAQYWLVHKTTQSPLLLSLLGVSQFLPIFMFTLFAGAFIAQIPKKKILIITQLLFMLQALTLGVLTITGSFEYWHILVLSFIFGTTQAIDMPARQTYLFELVGKDDIMNAVSLNSTIVNIGKIAGPAVAGMLMLGFDTSYCFFINAASYIAVLGSLFLIKTAYNPKPAVQKRILPEVVDGFRYISKNRTLIIGIIIFTIVSVFALNSDVILPDFSENALNGDVGIYSGLLTAAGIGSLAGALFMANRSKSGMRRKLLILGGCGTAIFQILTVLTSSYYVSMALLFGMGFMNLMFLNTANALFQLNTSDEYRSRVMSVYSLLLMGTTPAGNFLTGVVMDSYGSYSGFLFCGAVTLLLLAFVFMAGRKSLLPWLFTRPDDIKK